jgi:sensor histidine kinase YesM
MNNIFKAISIHILAWALLLMVPFTSTYQVIRSLAPDINHTTFAPVFVLSIFLIVIFYFNYFILIPKFLLVKKYKQYIAAIIATVAVTIAISGLIFNTLGLTPENLANANPIIQKISPIARANAFLMFVVAFVTSISISLNNQLKQTEKEKLSAQLSSLKSQINPHFLFNTLNSIYATAIDVSPQTADMVDKLSEMMRYTMKETQNDFVLLEEELNYIGNYIELQKIRLDENIRLDYHVQGNPGYMEIAPMLLIPFVENAFKHGVNAEQESQIEVTITITSGEIHLDVVNNKVNVQLETSERSGLGIANTKHRLELVYPDKHLLTISENEQDFRVSLHINLV